MPDPLHCSGLMHAYGDTPVLAGVDLRVGPGEVVAVLGSSGCGKTTLLRSIAGLVTPNRGRIDLAGTTVVHDGVESVPAQRRGVGLVFQEYALFPSMTVADNVGFACPDRERVQELLELVGLPELAHRKPAELSGGQQQRIALARALAPRPTLLLLDEPFANVDADRREQLGDELRRITRAQGSSVLLVTHDRRDALALCDRVVVLEPGPNGATVAQDDSPDTLWRHPNSAYVARLTGPCWFVEGEGKGRNIATIVGSIPVDRDLHGSCIVGIRPTDARFVEGGNLVVRRRQFVGGEWQVVLDIGTALGDASVGTGGHLTWTRPATAWSKRT